MALKTFRPLTPSNRFKALPTFDEITKSKPGKSLVETKHKTGGRNHYGRITCRHIGGGHKQRYRLIDFKRDKDSVVGAIERLEYDPNRSATIALVLYSDGERRYIIAPNLVNVGDSIMSGPD